MSLKSILKEMEENRPNSEINIHEGSPNTYGGRVGLKMAATEALKRLRLQYRNELMATTAFILVTGSESESFTNVASSDSFGCFNADPEEFYRDLSSRIDKSLFGREGVRQLFNIAGNILEDKALELDIGSYPMLQFSDRYNSAVSSVEDFIPLIRRAINDQVGSEIVGINAINTVTDLAIKKGHSASVAPVILKTDDEAFVLDLQKNLTRLTPKVFLVVVGKASKNLKQSINIPVKTVSEETVGEALSSIRNKILQ